MLRSSLLAITVLIAGAGLAQKVSDPQAAAPIAYGNAPADTAPCDGDNASGCDPGSETQPLDDDAYVDYAPDYWDEAPVYASAPFYLGISLIPDGYWGWPYYAYAPFGYGFGWPYYGFATFGFGFGWPYYGFASYWGGGYWNHHDRWHGHDGDHGHHGYHGPYRYMGHGRYADQVHGTAGRNTAHAYAHTRPATRTATATSFVRASAAGNERGTFTGTRASSARVSALANVAGSGRFAGRAALPSASYYAAARGGAGNAALVNRSTSSASGRAVAGYRGTRSGSYAYGRGNGPSGMPSTSQPYRVTSIPHRGYAAPAYRGNTLARSNGYVASRGYAGPRYSYPQQHYAPSNRGYGAGRGPMPSYSRGGSGFVAHAGGASSGHGSSGHSDGNHVSRQH